jgi:hypothetical protein
MLVLVFFWIEIKLVEGTQYSNRLNRTRIHAGIPASRNMAPSPLTTLAEELLEHSRALDAYNETNGLQPVSFDHESFVDVPGEVEERRKNVINLAQDVKRLAQGPRDLLFETLNTVSNDKSSVMEDVNGLTTI